MYKFNGFWYVFMCNSHHKEDRTCLSPRISFLSSPLRHPVTFISLLSVTLLSLPVSRISCDWNHTLLTLLYLAFFVEANAFEIHSCHFVYQRFVLFCCSLLFFGMDVPQFIYSPVDGHFFLDEDECEWSCSKFLYKPLCGIYFHFSRINT